MKFASAFILSFCVLNALHAMENGNNQLQLTKEAGEEQSPFEQLTNELIEKIGKRVETDRNDLKKWAREVNIVQSTCKKFYKALTPLADEIKEYKASEERVARANKNNEKENMLAAAATIGEEKYIKWKIRENKQKVFRYVSWLGEPLLHIASRNNRSLPIVRLLIRKGACVNLDMPFGQIKPLHTAAYNGSPKTVQFLIDNRANVNSVDCHGNTALYYASMNGDFKKVQILLKNGAKVNVQSNDKSTPLHSAYSFEVTQLLLEKGACWSINQKNSNGSIPLHSLSKSVDRANLLVAHGAKINERNHNGETPLFWSISSDAYDVVKFLLENGAEVNIKNNSGSTPLHSAFSEKMTQLLLDHEANINETDDNNQKPIDVARELGRTEVVELLEQYQKKA